MATRRTRTAEAATGTVKASGPARVAVYMRVSTDGQDPTNQQPDVDRKASEVGVPSPAHRYVEIGSAKKVRPKFEEMLRAAERGEFDVLVIWSIDRFGRTMGRNIQDFPRLDS